MRGSVGISAKTLLQILLGGTLLTITHVIFFQPLYCTPGVGIRALSSTKVVGTALQIYLADYELYPAVQSEEAFRAVLKPYNSRPDLHDQHFDNGLLRVQVRFNFALAGVSPEVEVPSKLANLTGTEWESDETVVGHTIGYGDGSARFFKREKWPDARGILDKQYVRTTQTFLPSDETNEILKLD